MSDLSLEMFKNPPVAYRGKPFWAWNGDLEETELRRQIKIFKKMGMGGFFMHSRTGLRTQYLGDKWFDLINACCEEASKQNMEAWVYDEDRWPSGVAGGLVTCNEAFAQKRLQLEVMPFETFEWLDDYFCVYVAVINGINAYNVKRLKPGQLPQSEDDNMRVLAFRQVTSPSRIDFNGTPYLDTMDRTAVRAFIEQTHIKYLKMSGQYFGNVIHGIFTDEPNTGPCCEKTILKKIRGAEEIEIECYQLPWTSSFPDFFKERYGYDLLDNIVSLFFNVDGRQVHRARQDYHDCRTFLFCNAFARQIYNWCLENKLDFTGHVLWESPLSMQADYVGGAMRFYEYMQIPGVDILTKDHFLTKGIPEYETLKYCASIKNQCGRKWMLSELYGCTGWDFSFKDQKLVGDWQAALGANVRCHHICWYSMQGEAKRDFPPSIFYQSPWWSVYSVVEDYFSRVNYIMSQGSAVRKLLVVSQNESMWQNINVGWKSGELPKQLDQQSTCLCKWLLEEHIDFDYGDEDILSRLGAVIKSTSGSQLKVGHGIYDIMLIPDLVTIRSSTLKLAEEFISAGGTVICVGSLPEYVDAIRRNDNLYDKKYVSVSFDKQSIVDAVAGARTISILNRNHVEETSVLYLMHQDEKRYYLFLCNTDAERTLNDITIELNLHNKICFVEEWDAQTGDIYRIPIKVERAKYVFKTDFIPAGSRLYIIERDTKNYRFAKERKTYDTISTISLGDEWPYELTEPNVLVLDKAKFKIGTNSWQWPADVLRIDKVVRNFMAIPERCGGMIQPWARQTSNDTKVACELEFSFAVEELPCAPVNLAIENPERFKIRFNGNLIDSVNDAGWWVDKALKLLPLELGFFQIGTNNISIVTNYGEEDALEAIYALGDFGVLIKDRNACITKKSSELHIGDWATQTLPFYSGSVLYSKNLTIEKREEQRIFLELPKFAGSCACVYIEHKLVGIIGWPPYELDITDYILKENINLIIEIISHRRNSFGPLHYAAPSNVPVWIGPEEFRTEGKLWRDTYELVPCGLLQEPYLSYRKIQQGPKLSMLK